MTRVALVVLVLSIASVLSAAAQAPETVLVNGKIVTLDARSSVQEALAIRDGKIAALGRSVDVRKLAGPATRIVDLGGRTVIPGLIDSHLHAVRAALSFTSEVNWIGARSLSEALARIGAAARAREPGAWLIVATPAAADVRAAGRGHEGVLPRAQPTRAHGRRRSRRQQLVPERLSGALRCLAAS